MDRDKEVVRHTVVSKWPCWCHCVMTNDMTVPSRDGFVVFRPSLLFFALLFVNISPVSFSPTWALMDHLDYSGENCLLRIISTAKVALSDQVPRANRASASP